MLTLEDSTEETLPIHCVPSFGRKHDCSQLCWCHPEWINPIEWLAGEERAPVFLHHVMH